MLALHLKESNVASSKLMEWRRKETNTKATGIENLTLKTEKLSGLDCKKYKTRKITKQNKNNKNKVFKTNYTHPDKKKQNSQF